MNNNSNFFIQNIINEVTQTKSLTEGLAHQQCSKIVNSKNTVSHNKASLLSMSRIVLAQMETLLQEKLNFPS